MSQSPSVVILNDTSTRYHHGCARVMRLLVEGLEKQGFRVTARSPARHDWPRDAGFCAQLQQADLIVINGEGTLHDGKPHGAKLLEVMTHPARGHTPVALVNALYENNPAEWGALLQGANLIAARDSKSAQHLATAIGRPVRWLPDLSLSAGALPFGAVRHGTIIGDSVRFDKRRVLARLAQSWPDSTFMPTKTLQQGIWRWPLAKALLYRIYNGVAPLRIPPFDMAADETAYLAALGHSRLHITGRFHGICLSLVTGTPFLALGSVSNKVETLLTDAGLGTDRLWRAEALAGLPQDPAAFAFTPHERAEVANYLALAQHGADKLFADLRGLVA